ncbi:MAG: hypothetical protein DMF64_18210 [Acidobacteria bacterium]|nr:MAG: hypothetical protein DMF64_18210 [Acidobacteriota bacterium]
MKRCFVISPIGQEGTPIREHADDVFDFIIKPAMDECGIEAWRSDHLHEPGKISDQMFRAILNEDLCIALLTGYNPNVFYELAVAQCAGRPVIIMAEKGHELPFDIRDLRCVYYDFSPRQMHDKVYVKQIVAHIRSLEASGWQASCPFEGFTTNEHNNDPDRQIKYLPRQMNYRNTEQWGDLLRETEGVFETMGISPDLWRNVRGFRELVLQKTAAGCKVRVLIVHEDNSALPQLINPNLLQKNFEALLVNNREILQFFQRLAAQTSGLEVRRIMQGCPHFRLTRTDQLAVLTPYFYAAKSDYSPVWEAKSGSSLYELAQQEFDALWEANEPSANAS